MVLILNYLPYLFIALGIYLCFYFAKKYKGTDKVGKSIVWTVLGTITSWFILAALTASYMPKGTVERIPVPDYTQDPASETKPKLENRLLNTTKPAEETQKKFDALTDWRAAKAERANPKPLPTTEAEVKLREIELQQKQVQQIQDRWEKSNKNLGATETQELPLPAKQ